MFVENNDECQVVYLELSVFLFSKSLIKGCDVVRICPFFSGATTMAVSITQWHSRVYTRYAVEFVNRHSRAHLNAENQLTEVNGKLLPYEHLTEDDITFGELPDLEPFDITLE